MSAKYNLLLNPLKIYLHLNEFCLITDTIYGGWFTFTKQFEKARVEKRGTVLVVTFEKLKIVSQNEFKTFHYIHLT